MPLLPDAAARADDEGGSSRLSQEHLARMLGIAADAVIVVDTDQRIVFVNEGAERIFDYAAAELLGRPLEVLIPERFREIHRRHVAAFAISAVAARRMGERLEIAGLRRGGEEFPAEASILKLSTDDRLLLGVLLRDVGERRRAERQLLRSEEEFRLLVEAVRDYAIFMLDATGHVASWNAGGEVIKGYRPDEIIGKHFSIFYPRESVERGWPETELRRAAANGRFEDEGWRIRKDGSRFWANVIITALRGPDGELLGYAKITRDLTERREAEEQVRRREQQLAEAQRIAHIGSWEWDAATNVVTWSDEMYRVYGLDPGSMPITLDVFLDHVHPDDRAEVQATVERCYRERTSFGFEHRIVRPDGAVRVLYARGRAIVDSSGRAVRMVGTGQDITRQREAEERARQLLVERAARAEAESAAARLRESEARFRTMADTAPVLIWTASQDAMRDWFNRPWLEFTGRTIEEELGSGWAEGVHPADSQRCLDAYHAAFERREAFRMEYRLRRHDGEYRWVLEHGVPRVTPAGALAGYIGSCMDMQEQIEQRHAIEESAAQLEEITAELEQTVDELQHRTLEEAAAREEAEIARRQAEEANSAKTQFLAVMSHELRTPLNVVLGFSDLLAAEVGGPLTDVQRGQLGKIRASSWHLLDLINRVLSLSRIEAGKEDVEIGVADIAALGRESAQLVEPATSEKGLQLVTDIPATPLLVETDAGKIRQILLNLLNNAVKFTDSGRVELTIAPEAGGWVRVQVRDTGIGIAAEHTDRIFEPFTQVEPSSSRGRGGTGLGLSVTSKLARLLGGDVSVDSEVGHGSTFTLRLPPKSPPTTTPEEPE